MVKYYIADHDVQLEWNRWIPLHRNRSVAVRFVHSTWSTAPPKRRNSIWNYTTNPPSDPNWTAQDEIMHKRRYAKCKEQVNLPLDTLSRHRIMHGPFENQLFPPEHLVHVHHPQHPHDRRVQRCTGEPGAGTRYLANGRLRSFPRFGANASLGQGLGPTRYYNYLLFN